MNGRALPEAAAAAGAIPPDTAPPALALALPPVPSVAADSDDRWSGHALPNDHPAWMRDTLSISGRARALIASLKPVALKVVTAWEHRVRSIVIGARRLSVDASGSYRLE